MHRPVNAMNKRNTSNTGIADNLPQPDYWAAWQVAHAGCWHDETLPQSNAILRVVWSNTAALRPEIYAHLVADSLPEPDEVGAAMQRCLTRLQLPHIWCYSDSPATCLLFHAAGGVCINRYHRWLCKLDECTVEPASVVDSYPIRVIENPGQEDWAQVLPLINASYADQPYFEVEPYRKQLSAADFELQVQLASSLQGSFLLAVAEDAAARPVAISMVSMKRIGANWEAYQGLTAVSNTERGNGLARALKSALMQRMQTGFPAVREMVAETSLLNAPIEHLNQALGFQITATGEEFRFVAQ